MLLNSTSRLLRAGTLATLINIFIFASSSILAMPAAPTAYNEIQPDGTEITLHTRGDEHYNWMEDTDGYTVIKNNGRFEYAVRGPSGRLNANGMIVGRDNPHAGGLQKHNLPSAAVRDQSAKRVNGVKTSEGVSAAPQGVPPLGTIKNLVVMFRFSDHVGRTLPSTADVDVLFNAVGGDPTLAPTGSVKDVYFENSYGQMTLDSIINPGIGDWITVSNTEAYYADGESGSQRLWEALKEALDAIDAVVNFNDYDADNDGRIDSIAFIHSGYAAEWGGTDAFGAVTANRIWSHRWAIQPQWNSNDGVSVFDYHISPGVWGTSGSNIGRIGVISHETGHFFGLPDLYDTDQSAGDGIGSWGMMANSWGFDGSQQCPPHFSPWSKIDLGWLSATVISQPGQYSIAQAESNAEAYRIDGGFTSGEYLLIENRQNAGFDCSIPQGGVAIWHIDDTTGFNTQGYPGQGGWPGNGNHYRVALLQADGNYNLEKGNNRGDSTDMHHAAGVDAIGPGPGNHPNTDTYKNSLITQTGITISNISASSSSMTFCFNGCIGVPAPSSLSATTTSTSSILLGWTDNSSFEDGFTIERRSSEGSPWSPLTTVAANTTSYNNSGLSPTQTWFYQVRAFEGAENSAWSNTASATTDDIPPASPSGLNAVAASANQINLSWVDQAGNEDGYRVDWSDDGGSNWSLSANLGANNTSYNHTGLSASTEYSCRVRAFNAAGNSAWSNTASATTDDIPPASPSGLNAVAASANQINLSWVDQADNEDGYRVDWSDDGGLNWNLAENLGANSTSYNHTGLSASTEYSYRARAFNAAGNSAYSNIASATTDDIPPASPSGLNAVAASANQINLSWVDQADNEDGYRVDWSDDGGLNWNLAENLGANSTSYNHTGLSASTEYSYRARAFNAAGNSAYSNIASATTDDIPPASPSGLNAAAASANQINLNWVDQAGNEDGYRVDWSDDGGSNWNLAENLGANSTSYNHTGLSASTEYSYRARAFNAAGNSAYSNIASATTDDIPPASPSGLNAVAASANQINLSWVDQAGNEDGYRVDWSDDGGSNWNLAANLGANNTNYNHTGLSASTEYSYRVRAFNAAGNSAYSNIASTTTDDPVPFVDYVAQAQSTSEGAVTGGFSSTHTDNGSTQSIREQQSNGNPSRRRSSLSHRWTFNTVSPGNNVTLTANAWSSGSSDNDAFQFQWSTDASNYTNAFVVSSTSSANSQSMALPESSSGTIYIRVIDTNNSQGNSALDTVFVDYLVIRVDNIPVTPPAAPSALSANAIAYNQIDLNWSDNATDETGYEVERAPSGGSFNSVATVAAGASSYSDTSVSSLTTYDYRVRALKRASPSGYSNSASATTPDQPVGTITLSGNGFKVKGRQQVDLTWSGSSATNVDIYRDGNPIATGTANDGFYNDNIGVKGRATYQYEVCDADTSGCSNMATVVF